MCLLIEQHGDNLMINFKASNNPVTPSLGVMLNRLWYCQDYPDPYPPPPINQFNTLLGFSWCDISVVSRSQYIFSNVIFAWLWAGAINQFKSNPDPSPGQ